MVQALPTVPGCCILIHWVSTMKKLAASLFVFTLCLWAADFWTKPYTDWTDKEAQKMADNSPWAKTFSVAVETPGGDSGGGRGKGGGGGGAGGTTMGQTSGPSAITGQDVGGGSMSFVIRWQSALPVKQAFVRQKFGAEAGTSPEAKQLLEANEPAYVLVVSGLNRRQLAGTDPDSIKTAMMELTSLVIKGKDPIKPIDFRLNGKGKVDAVFAFPKTSPITVDDKEVEFQSKLGTLIVKQKFRLKDMMYNGKLEL